MLVGHSFGARVLEHAVESGVKLWDPEVKATGTPVRPRVDLVALRQRRDRFASEPRASREPSEGSDHRPPPRLRSREMRSGETDGSHLQAIPAPRRDHVEGRSGDEVPRNPRRTR